jgi:tetratricopeptide (TPR) repeat protein
MSKRLQEGKSLLEKGLFDQAIKELTIQISSEKEDIQAIYLRGIAHRKIGRLDASLKDFDKAIGINSQNPDLFSDRAITYNLMQRGQEAIKDMNAAVALDPDNPYRYSCRAYIRELLDDSAGAIEDYQKAITLDATDEVSLNNLGVLQEKLGKISEAKKSFQASDDILKKKGKYTENKATTNLKKDELKINQSADGKVSFESPEKQQKIADKEKEVEIKTVGRKVGVSTYLQTLKEVFSSKEELSSFFKFVKSFFVKS